MFSSIPKLHNGGGCGGVDGYGQCRYFNGHIPGSQNDINNYHSSGLLRNN